MTCTLLPPGVRLDLQTGKSQGRAGLTFSHRFSRTENMGLGSNLKKNHEKSVNPLSHDCALGLLPAIVNYVCTVKVSVPLGPQWFCH